jgi:hypothetical protein
LEFEHFSIHFYESFTFISYPREHISLEEEMDFENNPKWKYDKAKKRWIFVGDRKKALMLEKVLPRPDLWKGSKTGNIGLKVGDEFVYVKVVAPIPDPRDGKIKWFPNAGVRRPFKECPDLVPYNGSIDDLMMVNIMIHGG